jgi:ABC-type sugar transport system substrate-binding protein
MIFEPTEGEGDPAEQQRQVDAIVARGPSGAFAVAGLAAAIVLAIWLVFYFGVYVARGGGN